MNSAKRENAKSCLTQFKSRSARCPTKSDTHHPRNTITILLYLLLPVQSSSMRPYLPFLPLPREIHSTITLNLIATVRHHTFTSTNLITLQSQYLSSPHHPRYQSNSPCLRFSHLPTQKRRLPRTTRHTHTTCRLQANGKRKKHCDMR